MASKILTLLTSCLKIGDKKCSSSSESTRWSYYCLLLVSGVADCSISLRWIFELWSTTMLSLISSWWIWISLPFDDESSFTSLYKLIASIFSSFICFSNSTSIPFPLSAPYSLEESGLTPLSTSSRASARDLWLRDGGRILIIESFCCLADCSEAAPPRRFVGNRPVVRF